MDILCKIKFTFKANVILLFWLFKCDHLKNFKLHMWLTFVTCIVFLLHLSNSTAVLLIKWSNLAVQSSKLRILAGTGTKEHFSTWIQVKTSSVFLRLERNKVTYSKRLPWWKCFIFSKCHLLNMHIIRKITFFKIEVLEAT